MQFMYFAVIYMYLGVKLFTMATIVKFYWSSVGSSFGWDSLQPCDNFLAIPISDFEKGSFQYVQLNVHVKCTFHVFLSEFHVIGVLLVAMTTIAKGNWPSVITLHRCLPQPWD